MGFIEEHGDADCWIFRGRKENEELKKRTDWADFLDIFQDFQK